MRILVLSKRQYMGKDLLDDKFGRFYEIPLALSDKDCSILGICLSYRKRPEHVENPVTFINNKMRWWSKNLGGIYKIALKDYLTLADKVITKYSPDIIWAVSDSIHIIAARYLGKKYGIPYIADLYDNFKSFTLTGIPPVHYFYKKALLSADGVTCVSDRLKNYIKNQYRYTGKMITIENGVNMEYFKPVNKQYCRNILNLPKEAIIIGIIGSTKNRGAKIVAKSLGPILRKKSHYLLLAGTGKRNIFSNLSGDRVIDLGTLNQYLTGIAYNAIDLGLICNTDSAFGRYCFPQKFYEMLACRTPVLSAAVGSLKDLLNSDYPMCLYPIDDEALIADAINRQIDNRVIPDLPVPSWAFQADKLESVLEMTLKGCRI